MPYPTIQKPLTERAAAAVIGAMTGLIAGGQDDAARYVVDQLGAQLLRDVHGLAGAHTDPALVAWLRERVNAGAGQAELSADPREREVVVVRALREAEVVDTRPDPVIDPDADRPSTMEEKLKRALRVVLTSTAVRDVTSDEAFGPLVYRVTEACERDDVEPIVVLNRLGENKLRFAQDRADNPAAYLARQVADWEPEATAEERH